MLEKFETFEIEQLNQIVGGFIVEEDVTGI